MTERSPPMYLSGSGPSPQPPSTQRFATFAWVVVGYTLLVILYGAWVRISGSGAGCGDHWPTCNGEIVPRSPSTQTLIEYGHRLTSGVLGPMALVLVGWAWLGRGQQRATRICASLTLLFIVFEALIGAGLVLAELVADNASGARAVVVSLHLVNTLILTAVAALTAWFGAGNPVPRLFSVRFSGKALLFIGLLGLVLVSATGAVTALGDTLFPVQPTAGVGLWAHVRDDLGPGAHFLVRLRAVHPALAIAVGIYLATVAQRFSDSGGNTGKFASGLAIAVWAQMVLGAANIWFSAPGWMQIVHLLGAQVVWIYAVLLTVAAAGAGQGLSGFRR